MATCVSEGSYNTMFGMALAISVLFIIVAAFYTHSLTKIVDGTDGYESGVGYGFCGVYCRDRSLSIRLGAATNDSFNADKYDVPVTSRFAPPVLDDTLPPPTDAADPNERFVVSLLRLSSVPLRPSPPRPEVRISRALGCPLFVCC